MKHLLDSNTLIEAKNCYYGMTICPGYCKFTIPNVCSLFGVPYMNTFELLGKLDARFVLHA